MESEALKKLQVIPGVGKRIATYLFDIGIRSPKDLQGKDPLALYNLSNKRARRVQDRCLLYVFRCAVYWAGRATHDPEKLKWWNWKDDTVRLPRMDNRH